MKKIIAIVFILLIGLFVLVGCSSNTVEQSDTQQPSEDKTTPEQQPNQQQSANDKIPQPPALPEG